jgi:hypothetical protein
MKMKIQTTRSMRQTKAVLREKFIAMSAYVIKSEVSNKGPNDVS